MIASLTIDGLELIATSAYGVQSVAGLEHPDRRLTSYDKPGEDGGNVSASFYGSRAITIEGLVYGNGQPAVHEAGRKALNAKCAVNRDAFGYPILKHCVVTTLAGAVFFFDAEVHKLANPMGRGTSSRFLISLVAPDHRLYLPTLQTTGLITRPSGGGFLMAVLLPFLSGASTGGSATATNSGGSTSMPIIYLRDQLTSPYLINNTTGKTMSLGATFIDGQTVVINMAAKTIMLGGTTSYLSTKSVGSDWWGLVPSANALGFSTGSTGDTGTAEVTWYNAELGI